MVSSSSTKVKKALEILVRNDVYEEPKFKLHLVIVEEKDPMGAHSQIPPKVLLIHDIQTFCHCSSQELGRFELN